MKWYKHLSKMRYDIKVKHLLNEFGAEGYGVYNYILECSAFNLEPERPFPEIEENCEDLSKDLKIDTLRLEKIVKFCVNEGLLEINPENDRIMCLKLLKHLDNTLSNNPEIKKILNNFNKLQETSSDLKQIRLDKIRLDKINKDKNLSSTDDPPIEKEKKEKESITYFKEQNTWKEIIQRFEFHYKALYGYDMIWNSKEFSTLKKICKIFDKKFNNVITCFSDIFQEVDQHRIFCPRLENNKPPTPSMILFYINDLKIRGD